MVSPRGSPPVSYNLLELGVAAKRENERSASLQHSNSKTLPEVWVQPDEYASAPQVAIDMSLPIPRCPDESAPQVVDNYTLPEVVVRAEQTGPPPHRICGSRRRNFWIIFGVAVIAIVAIAVGARVGSKSKSNDSKGYVSPLPTSHLAAVNFTANGVDFNCVYYQLGSGQIYQSVWNSSSEVWAAYPVVIDGGGVLKNTPISADLQRKSNNERRHHVFYYDTDEIIRGKAASTPYTGDWDDNNGLNGKNYGGNGLSLSSYAQECDVCLPNNFVVYYDDGNIQYATPNTDSGTLAWSQTPLPAGLPTPAVGTQLAVKPLYAGTTGNGKFIVMFMATKSSKLARLLYNGSEWESEIVDTSLSAGAAIAAFTAGTFANDSDSQSNYTIQVLNTHPPEAGGGVTLSSYSSSSSTWDSSLLESGFDQVLNGSGLAANQAGRVYGTVLSDSGRAELTEWAWELGNSSYRMLGPVGTSTAT